MNQQTNSITFDAQTVLDCLSGIVDPYTEKNLIENHNVGAVELDKGVLKIEIQLAYPAAGYEPQLANQIGQAVSHLPGLVGVEVSIVFNPVAHQVQSSVSRIEGIRNIIAVSSGKGGVGKSTTALNLALALQAEGAKVGVLDADIYGPSLPTMLGIKTPPKSAGHAADGTNKMWPNIAYGLQTMSIGYMVPDNEAIVWRGPMASGALKQLLNDTQWQDLDYLILDMPPGTGDIQLTLAQEIPVAGAVIVSTPQEIALLDARKGVSMFQQVNVPVLGIIENMSMHICSNCGQVEPIFGHGGGKKLSEEYNVPLLGSLPLDKTIRDQTDQGKPTVAATPEGEIAGFYGEIARRMAAHLSLRPKDINKRLASIQVTELK